MKIKSLSNNYTVKIHKMKSKQGGVKPKTSGSIKGGGVKALGDSPPKKPKNP